MFAKPFPELSNKMNAWVTMATCQWLMGPSTVNDVQLDNGQVRGAGRGGGVGWVNVGVRQGVGPGGYGSVAGVRSR